MTTDCTDYTHKQNALASLSALSVQSVATIEPQCRWSRNAATEMAVVNSIGW